MKICLFDIDGTLLSTGGAGQKAFAATFAALFQVSPGPHGVSFSGRTDRAIVGDLFRLHGIEDGALNWERFVGGYLARLKGFLGTVQGRVLPGVVALVNLLSRRADIRLGLLTGNVRQGARLKLEHYQLENFFPFGAFGDVYIDRADVARQAVVAASDYLGMPIEGRDVTVLGDTLDDVRCARAIGAQVVAVATGQPSRADLAVEHPDLLLDELTDSRAVLELVERTR